MSNTGLREGRLYFVDFLFSRSDNALTDFIVAIFVDSVLLASLPSSLHFYNDHLHYNDEFRRGAFLHPPRLLS